MICFQINIKVRCSQELVDDLYIKEYQIRTYEGTVKLVSSEAYSCFKKTNSLKFFILDFLSNGMNLEKKNVSVVFLVTSTA